MFSVVLHSRFAAVASTQQWIAAVQAGVALERGNIYASNQQARATREGLKDKRLDKQTSNGQTPKRVSAYAARYPSAAQD